MIALVTATLNRTHLYLILQNVTLIYLNQNEINIIILDEHIFFYTEDMYSKELNNTLQ